MQTRRLGRTFRHAGLASIGMLATLTAGTTLAGPNAGGAMLIHTNPNLVFCEDVSTYCGQSGLVACEQAVTTHDGPGVAVWFAIASFNLSSSPRLSGVCFGIQYDTPQIVIDTYGHCGDFELHLQEWPASGSGSCVTWNSARTTHLTEAYWFAGYNYADPGSATFSAVPHPTGGGVFADDSIPALLDPIAAYGSLGFNRPGTNPCPNVTPTGACCFGCDCIVLTEDECVSQGRLYMGNGTSCDPNPCDCPPPYGACCLNCECFQVTLDDCLWGGGTYMGDFVDCSVGLCTEGPPIACCMPDGSCVTSSPCGCQELGGVWDGQTTSCNPNPCAPVATHRGSWGGVKSHYR